MDPTHTHRSKRQRPAPVAAQAHQQALTSGTDSADDAALPPDLSAKTRNAIALLRKWRAEAGPKNKAALDALAKALDDERKGQRTLFDSIHVHSS